MRRLLTRITGCVLCIFLMMNTTAFADEQEINLYARSAVLMDADSGRILYGKEAECILPNASTTKIMTLIVALAHAKSEMVVTASEYAASMPKVHLGVVAGERYYMGDLFYALMLESDNDAAVMIAEGTAGTVEKFADLMNETAKALGCTDTHFITPNGLDAVDASGVHGTTAKDLGLMMRYAIGNETFVTITQTRDYSFSSVDGSRSYVLHNKNALLDSMSGVISGKTGYTADAGYCYVCAAKADDRRFIVVLLGSGWPPHKTRKWQDTAALLQYGKDNYHYVQIDVSGALKTARVRVVDGTQKAVQLVTKEHSCRILKKENEPIALSAFLPGELFAPLKMGQQEGEIHISVSGIEVALVPYEIAENVDKSAKKGWFDTLKELFN